MTITLNLKTMSIEEKVEVMEALWRDLSTQAGFESPLWHQEVLRARKGEHASDWNETKKRIRRRTCE